MGWFDRMNEEDKKALKSKTWWIATILLILLVVGFVYTLSFCTGDGRFFGAPATGLKFWIWEQTPNTSCIPPQGKFIASWE